MPAELLSQALDCQLSKASAGEIQGGMGINKYSARAFTDGSYIRRNVTSLASLALSSRSVMPSVESAARNCPSSSGDRRSGSGARGAPGTKICARSRTA